MTTNQVDRVGFPDGSPDPAIHYRLKYSGDNAFQAELRRRADEYFTKTGQRERDCWQMYLKTAIILTSFAVLYAALVFFVRTWWQALPVAILLGLNGASIGLNIQHDASHNAYSDRAWLNRLMSMTLDLIGGSSHLWRGKHVLSHHTYTNVAGHDGDIDLGVLGRMAPHDKKRPFHRWQHYYLWPVYGFMTLKWQLYDDFWEIGSGKIRGRDYPRPRGWALVTFIAGKIVFLFLAFGLPLLLHPLPTIILYFGITSIVMGLSLAVIFQLAHAVEQADFPLPSKETGRIEKPWSVSQVESTVDFARRSRTLAWFLGGINFQIEHHLFARVCHIHYPAISKIVEGACKDFGIRYAEHRTFWSGVVAHFRWLKRMALSDSTAAAR
jgi:linoleoyl-CoA desaturase